MTIEELEAFVAAVRSDSFTMTDANMKHVDFKSDEILSLEEEFGTPLVENDASGRGVLTEAGQALLEEAVPLIRQYRISLKRMDTFRRRDTRPIVIGTLPIMDQYRLTRTFRRYEKEYPGVQIKFEEAEAKALLNGLQQNYYDAIIVQERLINVPNVARIPMASDELAVIVSPDHPMAEETGIRFRDLKNEKFFLTDPAAVSFGRGTQLLKDHQIPTDDITYTDPAHIFEAVHHQEGISIMPVSALMRHKQTDLIPLPFKPREGVNIVFAYKKDVFPTRNMENLLNTLHLRAKALPI